MRYICGECKTELKLYSDLYRYQCPNCKRTIVYILICNTNKN